MEETRKKMFSKRKAQILDTMIKGSSEIDSRCSRILYCESPIYSYLPWGLGQSNTPTAKERGTEKNECSFCPGKLGQNRLSKVLCSSGHPLSKGELLLPLRRAKRSLGFSYRKKYNLWPCRVSSLTWKVEKLSFWLTGSSYCILILSPLPQCWLFGHGNKCQA